ncbi:MAG: hypothetical protein UT51_C0009G0014 [Candidatus Nomurabacteria bacterium GW2011_GWC2_39_41]|uniref:Uncharacterized protein n=1 Tax=Candidatus Nomurabacteria bacterium GW2011_GWC2_39_41 TaxID=1618754 RepID=A0A837HTN4_9BACT|nr:MAG: hypothetical protein UT51_C0009G0014 [Candidatus Nomurabacteria bacterium GW2011_GWC2_39_41]
MQHDDIVDKFKGMLESQIHIAKQARMEDDRRRLMSTIGQDLAQMLAPFLAEVASSSKLNKETLAELMYQLRGEVANKEMAGIDTTPIINAIELTLGNFKVPEPKVTVTIPPIKIPDIKMPEEMNIKGWVSLMGVDLNNPLPVQLRDAKGNPIHLFENLTQILNGGGGGKHDFFTIKGFSQSAFAEVINPDGRIKVEIATGGSGLTDAELRAAHLDVQQVSGATDSVYVTGIFNSISADVINPDNRIKVELPTGGSSLTDAELRATHLDTQQVSGAIDSVYVTGIFNSISADVINPDNRIKVELPTGSSGLTDTELRASHLDVQQVSGAISSVEVKSMPAVIVTSVTNSVAAAIVDSNGNQYGGSNPIPITLISGALVSTIAVGPTAADAIDDNSAPIKAGGVARTANPTAVAGGDVVSASYDDVGRQLTRPVQARDLIATAYVSVSNGTETTLLAAIAGSYLDLIYVMGTNNSDVAVTVDLRAVTAGNIVTSVRIPANGTAGVALPVPIPQDETGNNWTADLPDITGTTVTLSALFSKEI